MAIDTIESRDYLILVADLAAGGITGEPTPGDLIIEADDRTFEVQDIAGEPCWRWSDPYHKTLRIHTKAVPPPPALEVP